ncbi:MAG: hypothetical protein AB7R69_02290 [Candidatus Babeliales bacterium]
MKNFKNHNKSGMTFIEVVIATFIVGSLLSSLLLLQNTTLFSVGRFIGQSERIFLLLNRLDQAAFERARHEKEPKKEPKKKEPSETKIMYEQKKIAKESSLKNIKNLVIEKVTAEWEYGNRSFKESMITFLYKPEKKVS